MALRDIKNETPKEFMKKSAKMYMKDVLKGAIAVGIILLFIFAYHLFSDGNGKDSAMSEYVEGIEDSILDILHIGGGKENAPEEPEQ